MKNLKLILWTLLMLMVVSGLARADGPGAGMDKETDRLLQAKEYIFERNWEKARDQLELYLQAYPKGEYRDEALYWLAQSVNKLSNEVKRANQVIALKEESIDKLNALIAECPESIWLDDGKTLKIELSGELALMGIEEHKKYIESVIAEQDKNMTDIKIVALNKMIELEPEAAIPVLETIVRLEKDPSIRKKGVFLLGRHYPEEAILLLGQIEKTDPDPTVREEAVYWITRNKTRLMPVQLNYFCFVADLEDSRLIDRIKQGQVNLFELPRVGSSGNSKIERKIREYFDHELSDVKFVSNGVRGATTDMLDSRISHRLGKFRVQLIDESLEKGLDQIKGKVRFFDLEDEKEYLVPFTVDDSNEQLIVMRKDGQVALMLLQFESSEEKPDFSDEPFYSTEFSNVLGCVVLSSRQGWNLEEMTKKTGVLDYGRAKAEIPDGTGKWILTGSILLDRDDRLFIARRATLVDPEGKQVAEAPKIVVPIDRPSEYELNGVKKE